MTSAKERKGHSEGAQKRVDAALADTFPASDAPPWTLGPPAWVKDRDGRKTAPLYAYCHARMVILSARASAQEAALAMKTNGIGAVLVADGAEIAGIVTDRDLAVRVVAADRNPRATHLLEIMSKDLATLAPEDAHGEALAAMTRHRIRRVPLIERGRAVGMVTLDDLVLEKAATLEELADVVGAQLVVMGPAQTRPFDEWRALERRHARGLNTWTRLVARVQAGAQLEKRDDAERAIEIVLAALIRRLTPASGKKLIARLPAMARAALLELPSGPDESVTRASLEEDLAAALSLPPTKAVAIVEAVGASLARSLRPSNAVDRGLPRDLRHMLRPHRASPRSGAQSSASKRGESQERARRTPRRDTTAR